MDRKLAHRDRIAILDVPVDVRRGRAPMHDRRGADQVTKIEDRRTMVGVGVRVDHGCELKPVIGEQRQIAVDPLLEGIDERGLVGLFAGDQIGLALPAIQLGKQHDDLLRGLRGFMPLHIVNEHVAI